jgi:molecular chaperone GrpE
VSVRRDRAVGDRAVGDRTVGDRAVGDSAVGDSDDRPAAEIEGASVNHPAPAAAGVEQPPDAESESALDRPPEHRSAEHLVRIDAALLAIAERLDRDAERAAHRERVIDRQHADIERLRSAERSGLLRPVVTDLCRLRNDLLRQADELARRAGADQLPLTQVTSLLASFADVVEAALERCGVAVMPAEPGVPFEPGRQHAVSSIEVTEPALYQTVAGVLAPGYLEIDGGRTVIPARVAVHRRPAMTREHADD